MTFPAQAARASLEARTVTLPPDLYDMAHDLIEKWSHRGTLAERVVMGQQAIDILKALTQNKPDGYDVNGPKHDSPDPRNYSHAARRRIAERQNEEAEDE